MIYCNCFRHGSDSSGNSVDSICGGGSQEGESSSPEDASEALLNRKNKVEKLEIMMFKEKQTLENLIQSMRALQLARKQGNNIGEGTVKEIRRRLRLYGFLLRSQREELHQCLLDECKKHGYDKDELMDILKKVPGMK